eukprot:344735-Pyramimonas_sp.AAC.1
MRATNAFGRAAGRSGPGAGPPATRNNGWRAQVHGNAHEGPHVQVFLEAPVPQVDVWRSAIGRARSEVVFGGAQFLHQPDLGARHPRAAEVADHHLRRERRRPSSVWGKGRDRGHDDDLSGEGWNLPC